MSSTELVQGPVGTVDLSGDVGARAEKVVVIGQGYVGLPLAVRAARLGYAVVGFELDPDRVGRLRRGSSFVEDVPDDELAAVLDADSYTPSDDSSDCAGFDIGVIAVATPLTDGMPDLTAVRLAARSLGRHLRSGATVILESTTYPGTTEDVVAPILEAESGLMAGADFHLGYSPERIDPGNPDRAFWTVPKVVSGIDRASLDRVDAFYARLVARTVRVDSPKTAELAKLMENTFRFVNIALVNELATFGHDLGIDVWAALEAARTKPYGFMAFSPGPGVGGHCLPIDPTYLSWSVEQASDRPFRMVALANELNGQMPGYVTGRVASNLNRRRLALNGARVLVLGVAYKANVGDMRESPALAVVDGLVAAGTDVRVVDGHVDARALPAAVPLVPLSEDELRRADLVLLLTAHDDVDYGMVVAESTAVLDTRHHVHGDNVEYL